MAKTVNDVLTEWTARGYIAAEPSAADTAKYTSFINQGLQSICGYCKLPLDMTGLPDGLFYPWVEISYAIMQGGVFQQSSGVVTSVKEGDTTINFGTNENKAIAPKIDYSSTLNAFKRIWGV